MENEVLHIKSLQYPKSKKFYQDRLPALNVRKNVSKLLSSRVIDTSILLYFNCSLPSEGRPQLQHPVGYANQAHSQPLSSSTRSGKTMFHLPTRVSLLSHSCRNENRNGNIFFTLSLHLCSNRLYNLPHVINTQC